MSTSCDVRTYDRIDQNKINIIVTELGKQGATITGTNPWQADVHKGGVVLGGVWDPAAMRLQITIVDKGGSLQSVIPTCNQVWDAVEPQILKVQAMPMSTAPVKPIDPNQLLLGQISSNTATSPITDSDRLALQGDLQNLDDAATKANAALAAAPAPTTTTPPPAAQNTTSAAAAVSGSSNTMLYVVGGAALLGAAYFYFRKKA